jgi:hypothetical protein
MEGEVGGLRWYEVDVPVCRCSLYSLFSSVVKLLGNMREKEKAQKDDKRCVTKP